MGIPRMIPLASRAFVVNNLMPGMQYDLCVLAIWDDTATTLTATNIVGCVQFVTRVDYPRCQSLHRQFLGGTMILVIGGVIVATLLVFIVILMVRYKTRLAVRRWDVTTRVPSLAVDRTDGSTHQLKQGQI